MRQRPKRWRLPEPKVRPQSPLGAQCRRTVAGRTTYDPHTHHQTHAPTHELRSEHTQNWPYAQARTFSRYRSASDQPLDGVAVVSLDKLIPPIAISRIEVLKGAASTHSRTLCGMVPAGRCDPPHRGTSTSGRKANPAFHSFAKAANFARIADKGGALLILLEIGWLWLWGRGQPRD